MFRVERRWAVFWGGVGGRGQGKEKRSQETGRATESTSNTLVVPDNMVHHDPPLPQLLFGRATTYIFRFGHHYVFQ